LLVAGVQVGVLVQLGESPVTLTFEGAHGDRLSILGP
jgi:hypothetical protein